LPEARISMSVRSSRPAFMISRASSERRPALSVASTVVEEPTTFLEICV
jgi:hypothetical protein